MEDFLKKYWTDQSVFFDKCLVDSFDMDEIFKDLINQIMNTLDESFPSDLIAAPDLFLPKENSAPKQQYLKKYSFVEFIQREKRSESQKKCKEKSESPMNYLSKKNKYSTLNLTHRKFKIIDYGNCYDYSDERYGLINTRQYRAPEVILSKPD